VVAKAIGGSIPPIVWDGVTNFTPKGMSAPVAVKVHFMDGPVANLHFIAPGNVFSVSQSASHFLRFNVAQMSDPRMWDVMRRTLKTRPE